MFLLEYNSNGTKDPFGLRLGLVSWWTLNRLEITVKPTTSSVLQILPEPAGVWHGQNTMDPRLEKIEILTFDCYGTLIDWEAGLRSELARLREQYRVSASVDALLAQWESIQFRQIMGPYRKYREILRDSLSRDVRRPRRPAFGR